MRFLRLLRLLVIAASLFCVTGPAFAQPVRLLVYGVRHTTDTIKIDGVLSESTWAHAPRVGEIRRIDVPGRRPAFPTEATFTWDANALYVAVACHDAKPSTRFTKRDEPLWDDEGVQILIDPDGDGRNYVEVAVNAANVVADRLLPEPSAAAKTDLTWNVSALKTAVKRHAAGWIVEMAIPWSALAATRATGATGATEATGAAGATSAPDGPPKAGEQWRATLYRIKRLSDGPEITALAPSRADHGTHDTERFIYLLFMPQTLGDAR